jgi:hypothetical protein
MTVLDGPLVTSVLNDLAGYSGSDVFTDDPSYTASVSRLKRLLYAAERIVAGDTLGALKLACDHPKAIGNQLSDGSVVYDCATCGESLIGLDDTDRLPAHIEALRA